MSKNILIAFLLLLLVATTVASGPSIFSVYQGGTGNASFTAHGVLIGEGASPLAVATPGTATYVLTSNGPSSDPTFQAPSGGGGGGGAANLIYGNFYCSQSVANSATTSMQCTSSYNVVSNQIIVALCGSSQSTSSITFSDSGPGGGAALTWNSIASTSNSATSNKSTAAAFWANPGSESGADTFTCAWSPTSASYNGMAVFEAVGATVASPIDTSGTLSIQSPALMNLSPSSSGDAVFLVIENSGSNVWPTGMWEPVNNTGVQFSAGYGTAGMYNFPVGPGSQASVVAVAVH